MSSIKDRLTKNASAVSLLSKVPAKYLYPGLGIGGAATYAAGQQGVKDLKRGRSQRKSEAAAEKARAYQEMAAMHASKVAGVELFSRKDNAIFPLASESGAISWRQSYLDGLLANKDKMGKMAAEQLKDMFPVAHGHKGHKHGYRQRSMTSGKDAGSALIKAFKAK